MLSISCLFIDNRHRFACAPGPRRNWFYGIKLQASRASARANLTRSRGDYNHLPSRTVLAKLYIRSEVKRELAKSAADSSRIGNPK